MNILIQSCPLFIVKEIYWVIVLGMIFQRIKMIFQLENIKPAGILFLITGGIFFMSAWHDNSQIIELKRPTLYKHPWFKWTSCVWESMKVNKRVGVLTWFCIDIFYMFPRRIRCNLHFFFFINFLLFWMIWWIEVFIFGLIWELWERLVTS